MKDPRTHRCPLGDLDYSRVEEGLIVCTECGRKWEQWGGRGAWAVTPLTVRPWR